MCKPIKKTNPGSFYEQLNFLLCNRIPRRYATLLMGWFSKIESPLLTKISITIWRVFAKDLNLSEAKDDQFNSLQACFIRQLKPNARTINQKSEIVTSPCDAIIGAHGNIKDTNLFQAKGFPYTLEDLLGDTELVERYRNGRFITLRLTASMYHRFHAPYDSRVSKITYISGDTWNVNPIALKKIEQLFCKNERAVIDLTLERLDLQITLVPVAAILVAGIKLHCLPEVLDLRYRGPNIIHCQAIYKKGEEMGYFQHGSTLLVFANQNLRFCENVVNQSIIRVGAPLFEIR